MFFFFFFCMVIFPRAYAGSLVSVSTVDPPFPAPYSSSSPLRGFMRCPMASASPPPFFLFPSHRSAPCMYSAPILLRSLPPPGVVFAAGFAVATGAAGAPAAVSADLVASPAIATAAASSGFSAARTFASATAMCRASASFMNASLVR